MKEYNVPIQSLIDHIKNACDVDPWAKKMVEELLKEKKPKRMENIIYLYNDYYVGTCPTCKKGFSSKKDNVKFCKYCGQKVNWE